MALLGHLGCLDARRQPGQHHGGDGLDLSSMPTVRRRSTPSRCPATDGRCRWFGLTVDKAALKNRRNGYEHQVLVRRAESCWPTSGCASWRIAVSADPQARTGC